MFPIMTNNSLRTEFKVGDTVYNKYAEEHIIKSILLYDGTEVQKASLIYDDVTHFILERNLTEVNPNISKDALLFFKEPFTIRPTEVVFKKSDAQTYLKCANAAWKAYLKFGYESRRKYKISKRKNQVSLKILPYGNDSQDIIIAIKALIETTYNGEKPYAYKVNGRVITLYFEYLTKSVITLPKPKGMVESFQTIDTTFGLTPLKYREENVVYFI